MIFQEISAGAISPQMPPCKAIVVNIGETRNMAAPLMELYSQQEYTVYVVNTTLSKLGQVLDRCREINVPAIVNCGALPPETELWHPGTPYNAALVSAGTYKEEAENILNKILSDEFASSFSFIGYQGYRCNPHTLLKLQHRYFEEMRLGVLRSDLTLCEPLVRNCGIAFIDMRAVRYSDFPCNSSANPNGMYAEEMCTVARYLGLSQNLKTVFIFGEESCEKTLTICNKLIAETIWHICEGIASNIAEFPNDQEFESCFQRKLVSMGENGESIVFITSYATKRWWMEVPSKDGSVTCIPCSINDYKSACSGEVPLRWLFFYQKQTL
jgi:hypothetical protein